MRLNENFQVPSDAQPSLGRFLVDTVRPLVRKVNGLAGGAFNAVDGIATAPPTTGTYATPDFLRNSAPVELGAPGSKYVIYGWLCVTAGTPGTWLQCRFLTGN